MGLLQDIQAAVVEDSTDLGPILLKLRLLASRLGSEPLAEWIKHESEGYPKDSELPDYRIIPVAYHGTFYGSFGAAIKNAPIPPYLIEKFGGAHWNNYELRQSIAAVDDLIGESSSGGGTLAIHASDLMLMLQGKVYSDYACNDVTGVISRASLAALQHAVRARVLELTLEIERNVPSATEIGTALRVEPDSTTVATVNQISQQIIYGGITSITGSGNTTFIGSQFEAGNLEALTQFLTSNGLATDDAKELSRLISEEEPPSKQEPFGERAQKWLVENLKKAADGTWKITVSVATEIAKEAALRFWNLK